jgi:hypothetical protein
MGKLTEIRVIANLTNESVIVKNHETGIMQTVAPNWAEVVGNLVVPWASSKEEYENKGRKLAVSTRAGAAGAVGRAWFWENSGTVYVNTTDAWDSKAPTAVEGSYWTLMSISYKDEKKTTYEVSLQQIR